MNIFKTWITFDSVIPPLGAGSVPSPTEKVKTDKEGSLLQRCSCNKQPKRPSTENQLNKLGLHSYIFLKG